MTYIILAIIILFVLIITGILVKTKRKLQFIMIKINEAESNIDISLEKKYDLLDRSKPLVNDELNIMTFLSDLEKLKEKDLSQREEHNLLKDYYDQLFKEIDDHEKLLSNEELISLTNSLNKNEVDLVAAVKYYNDNSTKLNDLIQTFPANIIRVFMGIRKKEFYSNEKRELYEILKQE